jgi:hypothetical protein
VFGVVVSHRVHHSKKMKMKTKKRKRKKMMKMKMKMKTKKRKRRSCCHYCLKKSLRCLKSCADSHYQDLFES